MPVAMRDSPLPSRESFTVMSVSLVLRETSAARFLFKRHTSIGWLRHSGFRCQEAAQSFQELIIFLRQANANAEEVFEHRIAADVPHQNTAGVKGVKDLGCRVLCLESDEVRLRRIGRHTSRLLQLKQQSLTFLNQQLNLWLQQRKMLHSGFGGSHGKNV